MQLWLLFYRLLVYPLGPFPVAVGVPIETVSDAAVFASLPAVGLPIGNVSDAAVCDGDGRGAGKYQRRACAIEIGTS